MEAILPSNTAREIFSQPDDWPQAARAAVPALDRFRWYHTLPVQFVGCGTSYYIGEAAAAYLEERTGHPCRSVPASVFRPHDGWGTVFITRSGTTTEVLHAMSLVRPNQPYMVVTNSADSPVGSDPNCVFLPAPEQSVVQTRSATSNFLFLRTLADLAAGVQPDAAPLAESARKLLADPPSVDPTRFSHYVYLGSGQAYGLAAEAALKMRESALCTTEAYHSLEYRHGPISLAGTRSLIRIMDPVNERSLKLADHIRETGATCLLEGIDPLLQLIRVHVEALHVAASKGINPDSPRNLTRSVVLSESEA